MSKKSIISADGILSLALDSMPLCRNLHTARDHSAHQVYSHCAMPLLSPQLNSGQLQNIAAESYHVSNDGKVHKFQLRPNLKWSNGEPLTAHNYKLAFDAIFKNSDYKTERIWLRNIENIHSTEKNLEIELKAPDFRFPVLTGLFSLSPRRSLNESDKDTAGAYQLHFISFDEIRLKRNPYFFKPENLNFYEELHFHLVQTPEANLKEFQNGRIDVTADTAFPYSLISDYKSHPSFHHSGTGIFCVLTFEGSLSGDSSRTQRKSIQRIIDKLKLSKMLSHAVNPSDFLIPGTYEIEPPLPVSFSPPLRLRLAYDNYYPNFEIAQEIQRQLNDRGYVIELVEDDYQSHSQTADLRLQLFKGLLGYDLSLYQGMLFNRYLRSDKSLLLEYFNKLENMKSKPLDNVDAAKQTALSLQKILNEAAALVPLFEVPGYSLRRNINSNNLFKSGELIRA